MRKSNRKVNVVYPEERDGRVKDANKKLKAQVKSLQKKIKQLESSNKTIFRAYGKSCDFIQDKLSNKSLKEVVSMVKNFDYKETENGRKKVLEEDFITNTCPRCGNMKGEGYAILELGKFEIESCTCGYRRKAETSEGIKGS